MIARRAQKNHSSNKRAAKREKKAVGEKLVSLANIFLRYLFVHCKQKTVSDLGDIFKQNDIAAKYLECDAAWKNFCHGKFYYHRLVPSAFETEVKRNIHLAGIVISPKTIDSAASQANGLPSEQVGAVSSNSEEDCAHCYDTLGACMYCGKDDPERSVEINLPFK